MRQMCACKNALDCFEVSGLKIAFEFIKAVERQSTLKCEALNFNKFRNNINVMVKIHALNFFFI